jgi:uncharacterized membrane protein
MSKNTPVARCAVCQHERPTQICIGVDAVRPTLAEFIQGRHPAALEPNARICRACLGAERGAYGLEELERDRGELSAVEEEVSRKAAEHIAIASHIDETLQERLTLGQRVADRVAAAGGSWPFLILFMATIAVWIAFNGSLLGRAAFDPYPYILLNLVLSCVAAVQAPIIMMSQNRAAARDRLEADEDFKINLKAEIEIAALHEKLDHLLQVQWARLLEIQQSQLEVLGEISARRR